MKSLLVILFIAFVCSGYATVFTLHNQSNSSKAVKAAGDVLNKTARILKKKYGVSACGEGIAMPDGIVKKMTLAFDVQNSLTKEELRVLLIDFAEELVQQINFDKNIRPFLKQFPFGIENVQIIVYVNGNAGQSIYDPLIGTAGISVGVLTYRTWTVKNNYRSLKNQFEESYEEALKAISESENDLTTQK